MRDGPCLLTQPDTPEGGVSMGGNPPLTDAPAVTMRARLIIAEREAHDRYRRSRGEPSARSAHWAWVKAKAALAAAGG